MHCSVMSSLHFPRLDAYLLFRLIFATLVEDYLNRSGKLDVNLARSLLVVVVGYPQLFNVPNPPSRNLWQPSGHSMEEALKHTHEAIWWHWEMLTL